MTSIAVSNAFAAVARMNAAIQELQKGPTAARATPPIATAAVVGRDRATSVISIGGAATATSSAAAAASSSGSSAKKREVLEFIALNRNAGTRKAYGSSWAGFARYLEKHHIDESKLDEYDVADYLRVRVEEQGVAAATLGNDRAAIADRLKNTDRKHVVHSEAVTSMMAVLRTMAAPSKPKQHMAAELMREMVEAHEAKGPSGRQNAWLEERNLFLMLLMMMAFLREGEAVALTQADVDVKTLRVQGKMQQVLHIFIARSKTDQAKVGHVVLLGVDEKNPSCCPVKRYEVYVAAVAASGVKSDMFFPTVAGTAMSSSTPCGIVQRAVKQANEEAEAGGFGVDRWGDPESYGSHSLRRGGVTTARANGVSMLDIQKHGRWKSLVVFSYVGTTAAEQLAVTNSFLGEAKATTEEGAAEAAGVQDEVPSRQAHTLRAAATVTKKKSAARSSSKGPGCANAGRGRKRGVETEGEDEDEEDTEEHLALEDEEDALLVAACSQGWKENEEKKFGDRRLPARAAKAAAAKEAQKRKQQRCQ